MTDLKTIAREKQARAALEAAIWKQHADPGPAFSLSRAMGAAMNDDWSDAKSERAASERLGRAFCGDLWQGRHRFAIDLCQLRTLASTPGSGGGYLQDTQLLGSLPARRAGSVVERLGAVRIPAPMSGTVARGAAPAATWLPDENSAIAAIDPIFGSSAVRPFWVGTRCIAGRQLLFSPESEAAIADAILAAIEDATDSAALGGTGAAGQPTGIASFAAAVTGASFNRAAARGMERTLLASRGVRDAAAVAFVAPPLTAETLGTRIATGSSDATVWTGGLADGAIFGVPAIATANAPTGTVICGDFSQLRIYEFRPVLVEMNPFSNFRSGQVEFRVLTAIDIVATHAQNFVVATAVT